MSVFFYQWNQPDFKNIARDVLALAARVNTVPMVGVIPAVQTGARDRLDMPPIVRRTAVVGNLSFEEVSARRQAGLRLAEAPQSK